MGIFSPFSSVITSAVASAIKSALSKSTSSGSSGSGSKSSSNSTSKPSSSSGSGSSGSLKSLLDAEAQKYGVTPVSDTPSSPYYRETSSGGGGVPSSSGGGLNPLAEAGYNWSQGVYSSSSGRSGTSGSSLDTEILNAVKNKLQQLENATSAWSNWQPPEINLPPINPPEVPTVTPPEVITQAPKLEGITQAPATTGTTTVEELPKGASGFMLTGGAALTGALPTAEELYDIYKKNAGENQAVKEYLSTPQFQGILTSGNIPLWMATDPTWQVFLRQLGVLTDAIRGRLGRTTGNETT